MTTLLGHPGENQFIVITIPGKLENLQIQIEERLNQAMTYFYPIHDREAGYVRLGNKDGSTEKVPFMGLAVYALTQQGEIFSGSEQLLQALSQPMSA